MFMKRKSAVTVMIILFICVAVYLNWSYTRGDGSLIDAASGKMLGEATLVNNDDKSEEKDEGKTTASPEDYFTNARLEKQKARDNALNILKEAADQEKTSQEARDQAAASMEKIAVSAVAETRIETLVKAKGFSDCVTLINEEGVNVIVKAPEAGLSASDISKIKDIVMSETDLAPGKIKIVEIK